MRKMTADNAQDVEYLAELLHESGREAVAKQMVLNRIPGQFFVEWDHLGEGPREGRRIMARFLLSANRPWEINVEEVAGS